MPTNLTGTYYPAEGRFHGWGTQLLCGDGASPELFEAVAEVIDIAPGTMETATFKRTHLRSPLAHEEVEAAMRSSGAFVARCNYRPMHESQSYAGDPGSVAFQEGGTLKFWVDRATKNWKIVLSNDQELPFSGFVNKYQIGNISADDGAELTLEIMPKNGAWHALLP